MLVTMRSRAQSKDVRTTALAVEGSELVPPFVQRSNTRTSCAPGKQNSRCEGKLTVWNGLDGLAQYDGWKTRCRKEKFFVRSQEWELGAAYICGAERRARSLMDRALDSGSKGWGFESLRARESACSIQPCPPEVGHNGPMTTHG